MKSLTSFLIEHTCINEGGHAVQCRPMTQIEAKMVYDTFVAHVLPLLKLEHENEEFCALGSWGKKFDDQTSGDIDVAVSVDVIAARNGLSLDQVEQFIIDVIETQNLQYKYSKGIHVISVQYPIPNTSDFGQVDIMPSTSLDFSKWMYYSPDFRKAESKYKGLYRNQLLMKILSLAKRVITKKTDADETLEYETLVLSMETGLQQKTKSYAGKRGLLKHAKTLDNSQKFITNNPDEIVHYAFGDKYDASDILTFEKTYKIFMSNDFIYKNLREDIIRAFIDELNGVFPIPSEVTRDFPQFCENA